MNSRTLKIIVFAMLLALYGVFLVHKVELPEADDMARHVVNGREILHGHFDVIFKNYYSYTEPNHQFINHNWLAGIVFYLLELAIGWSGLVMFKVAVLLAAFSILFAAALKKANFWLVAACSIPAILILRERSFLRPEIFSYLFIAMYIWLLFDLEQNSQSRRIWLLVPLQILWVNIHLFFIVGVALAGGFWLERLILAGRHAWRDPLVRRLGAVLVAVAGACLINPNFIAGAAYPLLIFRNYGIDVIENNSILQTIRLNWFGDDISIVMFAIGSIVTVASFFFNFRKRPIFLFLASAATIIVGWSMLRSIAFFGLLLPLILSANLQPLFIRIRNRLEKRPDRAVLISGFLIILLIGMLGWTMVYAREGIWSKKTILGFGLSRQSLTAGEFLKQYIHGPIFNDYDSGAYLIYNLWPAEKVFIDNRPEAYSTEFLKDTYSKVFNNESAWQALDSKYHFNALVFYQYDQGDYVRSFMIKRAADPGWALVWADTYLLVYVRNTPANAGLIQRFQVTPDNVQERLHDLAASDDYDDQVAAADTFNLLGRTDLAQGKFWSIVTRWPHKARVWMAMGEWEYDAGDPRSPFLAIMFLQRALAEGQRSAEVYSFLAASYQRTGQLDQAVAMAKKALKINPDRTDAREILEDSVDKLNHRNSIPTPES